MRGARTTRERERERHERERERGAWSSAEPGISAMHRMLHKKQERLSTARPDAWRNAQMIVAMVVSTIATT